MKTESISKIVDLVLKSVALGMGVAVVVIGALGALSAEAAMPMLGLGLAALAITSLQRE